MSFSISRPTVLVGETVSLTTESTGKNWTHTWRMGDGTTKRGASITHKYAAAGVYTITLASVNPGGKTTTSAQTIEVRKPEPPPPPPKPFDPDHDEADTNLAAKWDEENP